MSRSQAEQAPVAADTSGGPLAGLLASIQVTLGGIKTGQERQQTDREKLLAAIYPADIPSGQAPVGNAGSGNVLIASAELFGPRTGVVWDVRRVTISGLAASDIVRLYRVSSPGVASAVGFNEVACLTGGTLNIDPTYAPGLGALLLRAGQSMMIYGTGLSASGNIVVTWDGISVDAPYLGAYLL